MHHDNWLRGAFDAPEDRKRAVEQKLALTAAYLALTAPRPNRRERRRTYKRRKRASR